MDRLFFTTLLASGGLNRYNVYKESHVDAGRYHNNVYRKFN